MAMRFYFTFRFSVTCLVNTVYVLQNYKYEIRGIYTNFIATINENKDIKPRE